MRLGTSLAIAQPVIRLLSEAGFLEGTNVQKLSQSPALAVGTEFHVTDGFVVSGAGVYNGFFRPAGAGLWELASNPALTCLYNEGADFPSWIFTGDSEVDAIPGSEAYPWEADWDGAATLTHPAVQQLYIGGDPNSELVWGPVGQDHAELLNTQKLSLPADINLASIVEVTNGFVVSGATATEINRFYRPAGTSGGKSSYLAAIGTTDDFVLWNPDGFDTPRWVIASLASGNVCYSEDDVAEPWLATTWIGDTPTLTHPAVQQLAAPGGGALLVSGLTGPMATGNGVWRIWTHLAGLPNYIIDGQSSGGDFNLGWSIDRWSLSTADASVYSLSDTPTPLTATNWKNSADDTPASITIALTDPQGGVFVSGGTQDGVYTDNGTSAGKHYFNLLAAPNSAGANSLVWSDTTGDDVQEGVFCWRQTDVGGLCICYSLSAVATPDLASNWKNASDDTPATITVTSVSQGELDAGVTVAGAGTSAVNGVYPAIGNLTARKFYELLGGTADDRIINSVEEWNIGHGGDGQYGLSSTAAFPFGLTFIETNGDPPAPTVTRNNIAAEANWDNV